MSELLSVDEYRKRILSVVVPLASRRLLLSQALGLVMAGEVQAERDFPPFASSAMDGFALRAADLEGACLQTPVRLRPAGPVLMGQAGWLTVGPGETVAVPTGGMIPEGADAVVPIELCKVGYDEVLFSASVVPGKNVRPAGEDVRTGQVIVTAGRLLGVADIGVLASAGVDLIDVRARPRVGILSTGDELVRPGTSLAGGQIYDSNSFTLAAAVRTAGGDPVDLGYVADDPAQLLARLDEFMRAVDMVVCSGGVSAGANDPLKRAFSMGDEVQCVNVAIQPGRPQAFGIWKGVPLFGLPGNPGAALVSFYVFVCPALARMQGADEPGKFVQAVLGDAVAAASDKCRFLPARLLNLRGTLTVTAMPAAGSNLLTPLAAADCLLEVPTGRSLAAGDNCRVIALRPLPG